MTAPARLPVSALLDKPAGNIYFVRTRKAIKIGYAKCVRKRLTALQVGNSNKLKLMFSIPGTKDDEARIQNLFRHDRIRGEWFSPTDYVHATLLLLERQGSWAAFEAFVFEQDRILKEQESHPITDALMYTVERLVR